MSDGQHEMAVRLHERHEALVAARREAQAGPHYDAGVVAALDRVIEAVGNLSVVLRSRGIIAGVAVALSLGATLWIASMDAPAEAQSYLTPAMRTNAGLPVEAPTAHHAEPVRPALTNRADRIAEVLRQDGETAARVLPAVLRLGSHLSDAQGYEIAWAIARSTRQHGLRPELVAALISVESGYRPGVVSPTNDHGLMQLHGEPVYDIERNIALGCEELATWRATYDCGEREMLAHYNGGCRPPGVSWSYADRVLGLAEEVAPEEGA